MLTLALAPGLVLPRFEAKTLREALSNGALPVQRAVDYAIQMAEGLAAVHERGLVHGELNPTNVAVDAHARVRILGCDSVHAGVPGVAAARATPYRREIAADVTVAAVGYMSPERIRGDAIDHRSDIFSLGVILHEMLTGEHPFNGATVADRMGAMLKHEPAELRHGSGRVSPSLVGFVKRCLEKAPAKRFQTAREVACALAGPTPPGAIDSARTAPSRLAARSTPLTVLQYKILRRFWPIDPPAMMNAPAYEGKSKLGTLFDSTLEDVRGKTVIDFGCGYGLEAIELAQRGAARVIGVDSDLDYLAVARYCAKAAGVSDTIEFSAETRTQADVILSLDAFEHFADPVAMLQTMHGLLRPGGVLMVCFGPPWYHPLGGHLFSVFPWAHLIFSEAALLRWREDRRLERVDTFLEIGLNQMTVRRFERLIKASPFEVEFLQAVPVRRVKRFHNRLTREFFTSIVRCKLRRPL
jgi:SAM-dependent methyltransferase